MCKCAKRMFVVVMTLVMLVANVDVAAAAETAESVGIVESDDQLDFAEGKLSESDDHLILQDEPITPENQATLVEGIVADEPNDESGDTLDDKAEHGHIWSTGWEFDAMYHWHEREAEGCMIVEDDEKDGYEEHVYFYEDENWFGDERVCQICGYDATELFAMLDEIGLYAEYTKPPVNLPATPAQSYKEAYDRIIAAMKDYPEGLRWTSYEPYSLIDPYRWQTYVRVPGYGRVNQGVGCAGFAFIMSDLAFKDLPARLYTTGQFKFEDVKVGDIIRYDTGKTEHVVIILQVSEGGVIVAEGNYNSSVHWGRVMSREQIESALYFITRWPEGFTDPDMEDADEVVDSGIDGELNWQITKGGVLTISGTGAMPNYTLADSKSTAPWSDRNALSVIIEGGITSIGEYAFYKSSVLNAYIPEGVTTIGQNAFAESALVSVTIPSSAKTIGKNAFAYCRNLVSASISDGVVTIGDQAFRGCEIKYIDLPATIESVGAGAFMSCQVTQVRFAPGTKKVTMGDNMFSQCWELTSVLLPEGANRISAEMFASCSKLKKIYVPKGVSEIGDKAFTQCPRLSLEGSGIFFEGSEQQWNDIGGKAIQIQTQPYAANVYFNQTFDNPFAADPNATDLIGEELCVDGHTGTADADGNCTVCGKPMGTTPVDPNPIGHQHQWSADWQYDDAHHWHECMASGCDSTKGSYGTHSYTNGNCICGKAQAVTVAPPIEEDPGDKPETSKPSDSPGTSDTGKSDGQEVGIPVITTENGLLPNFNHSKADAESVTVQNSLQNQWPGLFAGLEQSITATDDQSKLANLRVSWLEAAKSEPGEAMENSAQAEDIENTERAATVPEAEAVELQQNDKSQESYEPILASNEADFVSADKPETLGVARKLNLQIAIVMLVMITALIAVMWRQWTTWRDTDAADEDNNAPNDGE